MRKCVGDNLKKRKSSWKEVDLCEPNKIPKKKPLRWTTIKICAHSISLPLPPSLCLFLACAKIRSTYKHIHIHTVCTYFMLM